MRWSDRCCPSGEPGREAQGGLSRRQLALGLVASAIGPRTAAGMSAPSDALPVLDLDNLYAGPIGRTRFAPKVEALAGQLVAVDGYFLPHLRPGAGFACLAATPAVTCPHCRENMVTIPWDMVVWYPADGDKSIPTDDLSRAVGELELGARRDPRTGFVSVIRLRSRPASSS